VRQFKGGARLVVSAVNLTHPSEDGVPVAETGA
jgi:hypothetical protein